MSLVESLKGKPAKSPSPAEIQNDLRLAESALAELEASHGGAALDAMAQVAGADAALRELEAKLAAQRQKVATLQAAHRASVQREQDEIARQRSSLQKTQLAALRKHVEARNAAAIALADALAKAGVAYRELQTRSGKARAATPIGMTFPEIGDSFGDRAIEKLVVGELWRTSAQPNNTDGYALPGAHFTDLMFQNDPERTPALVDAIKAGSDHVLSRLKLKAPE